VTLFTAEGYGESGTECFDPSLLPAQDVLYVDAVLRVLYGLIYLYELLWIHLFVP